VRHTAVPKMAPTYAAMTRVTMCVTYPIESEDTMRVFGKTGVYGAFLKVLPGLSCLSAATDLTAG
jgi:hypothetical protein